MSTANTDDVTIAKYLRKRFEYLQACNADIENRLSNDAIEFINTCDDEDTCFAHLFHIESVVGNTFRYSMILAVCTFLEEAVKFLCQRAVADYAMRLKASGSGTWLAKHSRLLADHTTVDLAGIKEDMAVMEEFVQVRNCIAHAWGKLGGCRNKQQLREIVERVDYFMVSADGYLLVEDQAVPTAAIASGQITDKLIQDLLGLPAHCVH